MIKSQHRLRLELGRFVHRAVVPRDEQREIAKPVRHGQARAQALEQLLGALLVAVVPRQQLAAASWPCRDRAVSTAKRTVSLRDSRAAMRSAINVCTPVSISGCQCSGCGTPNSASTSGKTRCSAPQARSASK